MPLWATSPDMESSGSSAGGATATASASGSGSSRRASSDTSCPPDAAMAGVGWYDSILNRLDSNTNERWSDENERILLEPYTYLDSNPGKEIRSQIIKAFNGWLRVDEAKLDGIRRVVRMLHTSSLLIDDVEDNSELRRGIPVAHKVYGVPQTINSANYVYFLAFAELFRLSPPNAHALGQVPVERQVTEELLALHRGQGLDLFWRDNLVCPTEHEYVDMVNNKTGGLLRIILKLMIANSPVYQSVLAGDKAMDAEEPPDLIALSNAIGLLFQIRDDYMNLQPGEYEHTKGFAEDLSEGKFSFPVIHAIRSSLGGAEGPTRAEGEIPAEGNNKGRQGNGIGASRVHEPSSISAPPSLGSSPEKRPGSLAVRLRSFGVGGGAALAPGSGANGTAAGTGTGVPLPIPGATPTLSDGGAVGPNHQILSIVRQRPTDYATKRYAIEFMKAKTRSFEYCRSVMLNLDGLVREEIRRIDAVLARREGRDDSGQGSDKGTAVGPADMLLLIMDKLRGGWYEDALDDERRGPKEPTPTPGGIRE